MSVHTINPNVLNAHRNSKVFEIEQGCITSGPCRDDCWEQPNCGDIVDCIDEWARAKYGYEMYPL